MVYVYVLRSSLDGLLYTGCTRDLRTRIALHNSGKFFSTKYCPPIRIDLLRGLFEWESTPSVERNI